MSVYPATNSNEAVELVIDAANQMHQVINGAANETVTTESGDIPSVRKAISDSLLFLNPLPWEAGQEERNFLQTREFDNILYWAPSATSENPIPMGSTPVGDTNWKIAPLKLDKSAFISALGKVSVGFWDENPELKDQDSYVVDRSTGEVYGAINTPYRVDSVANPNPEDLIGIELFHAADFLIKTEIEKLLVVSEDNVKSWVESGVPKITATGTAVSRALKDRFSDTLNALDEGLSPDNTAEQNNAAFLALCEKICQQGGIVEFQKGKYELGDVQFNWHNSSLYIWYDQPVRGFRGKGITNTELIFSTPENNSVFKGGAYWLRFEDLTFKSSLWTYTQQYHLLGTKVNLFDMGILAGGTGCPRLKIDNVKAVGFNRAFSFFTWVSEISHTETFQCRYGFVLTAGTSTNLKVCYAHDTWYGYVLGADIYKEEDDLTKDSVFSRHATTYTSLTSCACDRSQKVAYTIGELYGSLSSCGSEIPFDNRFTKHLGMIDFPPLVDKDGTPSQKRSDGQVNLDNYTVLANTNTFQNGSGIINVARNNCGITLGSLTSKNGGEVGVRGPLRDLLTFDDSVVSCNLDISGRMISAFGRMPNMGSISGIKVDGIYQGQVVLTEESLASQSGVGLFPTTFKAQVDEWRGNKTLRIALKGTRFENSGAMVKIDIADFSTNIEEDTFYGSVVIRAKFDKNSPSVSSSTFVQAHINGSNNNIEVTLVDSTKNAGGKDIKVAFKGDSAKANMSYNVAAEATTGARWSDGNEDKWLLWLE